MTELSIHSTSRISGLSSQPSFSPVRSDEAGAATAAGQVMQDSAAISPEARQRLQNAGQSTQSVGQSTQALDGEQQEKVEKLKKRDVEVRQHEQAHVMSGGAYVRGGPTYQMQTGPDGRQYAIGGEVNIDTSPIDGDPKATIRKAQQVQKAALAPAEPSGQDRAVAAEASAMEARARQELAKQGAAGGGSTKSVAA